MKNIGILGGGVYASALAKLLSNTCSYLNHRLTCFARGTLFKLPLLMSISPEVMLLSLFAISEEAGTALTDSRSIGM